MAGAQSVPSKIRDPRILGDADNPGATNPETAALGYVSPRHRVASRKYQLHATTDYHCSQRYPLPTVNMGESSTAFLSKSIRFFYKASTTLRPTPAQLENSNANRSIFQVSTWTTTTSSTGTARRHIATMSTSNSSSSSTAS